MNQKKRASSGLGQLLIPLVALAILIVFNLFRDIGFFSIGMRVNNSGNIVLTGNLISIIDSASELAIIAMGMTLVTAACGGQDISVGAVGAISGAVNQNCVSTWAKPESAPTNAAQSNRTIR